MKTDDMAQLVEDFTKVIQFKIITTIKNLYGSLGAFKASCRKAKNGDNKELARFNKNFHFDRKLLSGLTRAKDGTKRLREVLARLDEKRLVHKGKCTSTYKSGKKFNKPSTWHIPFAELEQLFGLMNTDNSPFATSSGYYTENQAKLISKYVYGGSKKRKAYTKSEKFLKSVAQRKAASVAIRDANNEDITDEDASKLLESINL